MDSLKLSPIAVSSFLILVAMLLFNQSYAQNAAGKVVAVRGSANASGPSGTRSLSRGNTIFAGDTLTTGSASRLLIRFADNSALALREDSQFRVNTFDTTSKKNSNSLFKGSMRMLTGAISKANPKGFEVKTPVAVIGVRGTEFHLNYRCKQKSTRTSGSGCKLQVWNEKGVLLVRNNTGAVSLVAGRYVEIGSSNDPIVPRPSPPKNICVG